MVANLSTWEGDMCPNPDTNPNLDPDPNPDPTPDPDPNPNPNPDPKPNPDPEPDPNPDPDTSVHAMMPLVLLSHSFPSFYFILFSSFCLFMSNTFCCCHLRPNITKWVVSMLSKNSVATFHQISLHLFHNCLVSIACI